eukprot:jgi/Psemu1/23812/gm1.23812_g
MTAKPTKLAKFITAIHDSTFPLPIFPNCNNICLSNFFSTITNLVLVSASTMATSLHHKDDTAIIPIIPRLYVTCNISYAGTIHNRAVPSSSSLTHSSPIDDPHLDLTGQDDYPVHFSLPLPVAGSLVTFIHPVSVVIPASGPVSVNIIAPQKCEGKERYRHQVASKTRRNEIYTDANAIDLEAEPDLARVWLVNWNTFFTAQNFQDISKLLAYTNFSCF